MLNQTVGYGVQLSNYERRLRKNSVATNSVTNAIAALATHHSNINAFLSILSIDFALLATRGLLSLAGSNRAADTESQRGALKSGAQLWAENCIMCHEVRPRVSFTSAKLDSITRHMQILDECPDHHALQECFEFELQDHLGRNDAEKALLTAISWGRYAELYTYDDQTREFGLDHAGR